MLKKIIGIFVLTLFFVFQLNTNSASALELDAATRTVKLNPQGDTVVLDLKQIKQSKKLFSAICSPCHLAGRTKTNPNVTLALKDLAGAEPPRDNIVALVDFLKQPMSYDGEQDISLLHPNTERSDLFPGMRNLTDEDLELLAGHILLQDKVLSGMWGAGKVYN